MAQRHTRRRSLRAVARLTALIRALVAVRWLVPWACALLASSMLAPVADGALVRVLPEAPSARANVAAPASASPILTVDPDKAAPVGAQWLLSSTTAESAPLEVACVVAKGKVAADVLEVPREDLGEVAADRCTASSN